MEDAISFTEKTTLMLIIGIATLFIATFGATYAYFTVVTSNDTTNTLSTGSFRDTGNVSLTTNTANLYLNLNGVHMSEGNIGTKYYATSDVSGTPILESAIALGNGIYTLATASISTGETVYDCSYNYDISATLDSPITDGSDEDIKITIKGSSITGGGKTYTLKQILEGNQTLTGLFKNVTAGTPQTITIESTVENTSSTQDDFVGNRYTITITPKTGNQGFSCVVATPSVVLSDKLISDGNMWQSTLEGDGYRFTGSGAADAVTSPDNFICFGTTSKETCKANEDKYLYRIIGVFEDTNGNNSVKLIKYKQLERDEMWHNSIAYVSWENSDMYNELNGSRFLTNTDYDYMQDGDWLNKISNWTWSAVNTKTNSTDLGPNYYHMSIEDIYLHEMNRARDTTYMYNVYDPSSGFYAMKWGDFAIGSWSAPVAKIGLMYTSDYLMSLGSSLLIYSSEDKKLTFQTGWMHPINNGVIDPDYQYEWTMSNCGMNDDNRNCAWFVNSDGAVDKLLVINEFKIRPVFYLKHDVAYGSGSGDYTDPFITE